MKNLQIGVRLGIGFALPGANTVKLSKDQFEAHRSLCDEKIKHIQKLVETDKGRALLQNIKDRGNDFLPLLDHVEKLALAGKSEQAKTLLFAEGHVKQIAYVSALNDLLSWQDTRIRQAATEATSVYENARLFMLFSAVIALAIGIVYGIYATRSVTAPLQKAVSVANRIAEGDLTGQIDTSGQDETGTLLRALNRMQASLVETVGAVRRNADGVATASAEIAQGNTDLSQRTEEQAASLEETSASMEELTATVKRNTENAKQGTTVSACASEAAAQGAQVVGQVVTTITEVVKSVKRVADLMEEISAASGEQQSEIEQVNQAVKQMDQVTQQNTALVEEASAAAQSMSAQASDLRQLVSVFSIEAPATASTATRASPVGTVTPFERVHVAKPTRSKQPARNKASLKPSAPSVQLSATTRTDEWLSF